jgi:phage gp46-like protein
MDIQTSYIDSFYFDWGISASGLEEDDGLKTAVIISLFTDRRANADDALPSGDDRRGWWGDTLADVSGDKIGSRLWLLNREKQLSSVLVRAREYAIEALQWLVEDGAARSINATADIVRQGVLGLTIEIARPNGTVAKYSFDNFWKGE